VLVQVKGALTSTKAPKSQDEIESVSTMGKFDYPTFEKFCDGLFAQPGVDARDQLVVKYAAASGVKRVVLVYLDGREHYDREADTVGQRFHALATLNDRLGPEMRVELLLLAGAAARAAFGPYRFVLNYP